MQNELDRETASLQELEAQKQDAQDRLDEMDQQKNKLEDMMNEVRIKCQEESQMVRRGAGERAVRKRGGEHFLRTAKWKTCIQPQNGKSKRL